MIQFSCLTQIPEATKGLVREMRVRWMLEELGLAYEPVVYPHQETKKEPYSKLQPFGQVPYFKDGDFQMFETGAILIHLAEKYKKFLPAEEKGRALTLQWLFAATTSVEPFLFHLFMLNWDQESSESSRKNARKIAEEKVGVLSRELGDKEFFAGSFSIADIAMTTALRTANVSKLLEPHANLRSYVERQQARPAFQRALAAHEKLYP